jgi:hypothetical protein
MAETFRVWFQTTPPQPSWTAYKHRSTGTLSVAGDHARFVPRRGEPVLIENVFRVSKGWKASAHAEPMLPIVDTYIEVLYGERRNPRVAFINDGRWFGLATYLPHRKLLNALRSLVANNQH